MNNSSCAISNYGKALARLLYPAACQLCGEDLRWEEETVCDPCRHSFRKLAPPLCRRCSIELGPFSAREICENCESSSRYITKTWAVYSYSDPLKKLFHRIKFTSRRSPLDLFREEIQTFAIKHFPKNLSAIVPVPLDWKRSWIRGFNQAKILAQFISEAVDCPVAELLSKRIITPAQSHLKKKERLSNLIGSFQFRGEGNLNGQSVLIVDDIYTTGSTIKECGRILKENGAAKIYAWALARAGLDRS